MSALPRLKVRREFLRVAATRRKWATKGLILQVLVRPDAANEGAHEATNEDGADPPRVGFTVSKKVGNAVARNRARRRLRAVAEQVMPTHARPGRDFVVIGRRETVSRPFPALVKDLKFALRRLDAYRPGSDRSEPDENRLSGAARAPS